MNTQGASTSSLSIPWWNYDVFLSFRGVGTHRSFADNLYAALRQKDISTVQDGGEFEGDNFLNTINESRFTIIILSRNYATLAWCLDKLERIVRFNNTRMTILPIFYDVDRSDVKEQTGSLAQAFTEYEELFEENIELWRAALRKVANLFGWSLKDRHESELIQEIVTVISYLLSSELVGIDSSLEELIPSYLGHGNHVYMIGICGRGGLGKTTLARVIYDMFCNNFEGSSFIPNVREYSEKYGLAQLQQQLLVEILKERNIEIQNVDDGVDMIMKRLRHKKVLIVLDDVDKLDQLKALAGEHYWFGLGSWIIITTKYDWLVQYGEHKIYNLSVLNGHDALKLFCLKAFKKEQPLEGYEQLSQDIFDYANGLPLALVTLGSCLIGRSMYVWQSTLDRLERIPRGEILDVLQVSYDGLSETEKEIFLDVACFFRGEQKYQVINILNDCYRYAGAHIDDLINKSLICIANQKLWMHDLLQEMGREIVCRESCVEPGKRSRLWLCEDLTHVWTKDKATKAIQAIVLNSYYAWEKVEAFPEPFSKMDNLRLLIIRDVIPNGLNHVPDELRYFPQKELVRFKLWTSQIKHLWEGVKYFDRLKYIDLRDSKSLIETPDFTGFPRLVGLCLRGCSNLVEIHPSIGQLRRLVELDLEDCQSLTNLLSMTTEMESLKILNLRGCSNLIEIHPSIGQLRGLIKLDLEDCRSLTNFPSITAEMQSLTTLNLIGCLKLRNISEFKGISKSLSEVYLVRTAIEKLPSSIDCLTALTTLNLEDCKNLKCLPSNIDSLRSLEILVLSGCSKLANLPETFWKMKCLKILYLNGRSRLEGIGFNGINSFSSLQHLTLSWTSFVSLPRSISQLSNLETLDLSHCLYLRSLLELPSTVKYINAQECYSLQPSHNGGRYDESSGRVAYTILHRYLQGLLCQKTGNETSTKRTENGLGTEFQIIIPGKVIPSWLTHRSLGNSIRIKLSPNWYNSKCMGFVFCARLDGFQRESSVYGFPGASQFGLLEFCSLQTPKKLYENRPVSVHLRAPLGERGEVSYISFGRISGRIFGWGQILLVYLSPANFEFENGGCCDIIFEFENRQARRGRVQPNNLQVLECGVRLVYKQDVEEFNQTIAQCSSNVTA